MRMGMRRFTRLTNGFSKKMENHLNLLSLYFIHYNFVRVHKTLRMTPAMAAGVSDTLQDTAWIVELIDANAPAPEKRVPYKKNTNSNRDRSTTEYLAELAESVRKCIEDNFGYFFGSFERAAIKVGEPARGISYGVDILVGKFKKFTAW